MHNNAPGLLEECERLLSGERTPVLLKLTLIPIPHFPVSHHVKETTFPLIASQLTRITRMKLITPRRTGRPPKRAEESKPAMLTLRVSPEIKNLLIDMADAYDVSITEYVTILVKRDVDDRP